MIESSNGGVEIEFWFDPASSYSYIAAADLAGIEARCGAMFRYRPFLLGPIFAAQGWNDSPFNLYPGKGAYMWRDLGRLCADRKLPLRRPRQFPRNSVLPACVALIGLDHEWGKRFVTALFTANFGHDVDTSSAAGLGEVLRALGIDPEPVLAAAADPGVRARLRASTEEAIRRGIFGAPSFMVGEELFWGTDRLEQAIRHAGAVSALPLSGEHG
ncbi:2-hydroxychromene-2-carboxylate isomerase [Azoarcus sp. L1K30]|uniref:2-hydroxychromene-2-carboxylate isomerase n=1 Tax=Azoarcus sp. L1K30 TaxID=2820277 RepID=UPI001B81CD7B|nr:2-hydroxychromene-2-carboxylate isomerase [Azoarcus sp. L1K30]MBR0567584.1 2-hydroxychromene-2-carboxylate isomerase [Azoarcus sp. L1K30]